LSLVELCSFKAPSRVLSRVKGLLIVAGVVTESLSENGTVLVAPGNVFTMGDKPMRLELDGTLVAISDENNIDININSSGVYLRLTADGTFVHDKYVQP